MLESSLFREEKTHFIQSCYCSRNNESAWIWVCQFCSYCTKLFCRPI